jgi:SAM-dependent methyltransferase
VTVLEHKEISCGVCGQPVGGLPVQSSNGYDLYHCRSCDVVFSHPMKNPGAAWYEQFQVDHIVGSPGAITWDHKVFLNDTTIVPGTLLDIGCGDGGFIARAQARGFQVMGIDFDSNALAVADANYGLKSLFRGGLTDFKNAFPHRKFDAITFFGVLEHLDDPSELLCNVRQMLNPAGHIAFTVPFRDRRPNFGFREWWDQPPFHLTRWSEVAVRKVLAHHGFLLTKLIKGRSQDDDVIDWLRGKVLKRGIVSGLVHQAQADQNKEKARCLMRRAVLLAKVAGFGYKVLAPAANLALFLMRATGKSMYVNAIIST